MCGVAAPSRTAPAAAPPRLLFLHALSQAISVHPGPEVQAAAAAALHTVCTRHVLPCCCPCPCTRPPPTVLTSRSAMRTTAGDGGARLQQARCWDCQWRRSRHAATSSGTARSGPSSTVVHLGKASDEAKRQAPGRRHSCRVLLLRQDGRGVLACPPRPLAAHRLHVPLAAAPICCQRPTHHPGPRAPLRQGRVTRTAWLDAAAPRVGSVGWRAGPTATAPARDGASGASRTRSLAF